jgi:beta-1,4-mannosyl-glycoprotein beta-1,4-N-acetylglucosaminyltransferase
VDSFVLIEGAYTFGGVAKPSHYKNNIERFAKWNHKIVHYWIENFESDAELLHLAKNHPNVGDGQEHWIREFYFKECAKKALVNLADTDIVFISDLDEIWNPMQLKSLTDFSVSPVLRPVQLSYYYFLNNRSNEHRAGWTGTIVCRYHTIRQTCINDLRSRHITKAKEVLAGGWHFTYMGGAEGAKKKLTEQNHPEYNIYIETIDLKVNSNLDYAGRNLKYWTDESDLPEYLLNDKARWQHLFK